MNCNAEGFKVLGSGLMNRDLLGSEATFDGRFVAYFGVSPRIVEDCWLLILNSLLYPTGIQPIHLLWTLMHLKVYATEIVLAGIAKVDEKTFRKWSRVVRKIMAELLPSKVI